jgi:hypothetical protein
VSEKSKFAYLDLSVLIWPYDHQAKGSPIRYKVLPSVAIRHYQVVSVLIHLISYYSARYCLIRPDNQKW